MLSSAYHEILEHLKVKEISKESEEGKSCRIQTFRIRITS